MDKNLSRAVPPECTKRNCKPYVLFNIKSSFFLYARLSFEQFSFRYNQCFSNFRNFLESWHRQTKTIWDSTRSWNQDASKAEFARSFSCEPGLNRWTSKNVPSQRNLLRHERCKIAWHEPNARCCARFKPVDSEERRRTSTATERLPCKITSNPRVEQREEKRWSPVQKWLQRWLKKVEGAN